MTTLETTLPVDPGKAGGPRRRPTEYAADLLGVTRGQVSTLMVALAVAVVLTIGGLPPVLRHRSGPAPSAAAPATPPRAAPADGVAAPAPSVAAPVLDPVAGVAPVSGTTRNAFTASPTPTEVSTGPASPPVGTASVFAPVGSPGAPEGIAVAADGTIFVATDNGTAGGEPGPSRILSFSANGVPGGAFTVTGQPADHALGLTGLVVDGRGGLFALDAATARVLRFDLRTGRQATYATLPNLPACQLVVAAVNGCEPGVSDDAPLPRGAALDAQGNLYVSDAAQGAIWRIAAGGAQPVLFTSDVAFGSGDGVSGLALAPDGSLLVVAPQAVDPAAAGGGAVYRFPVTDGKAGNRTLVAHLAPGEGPQGIALLDDGSMVVTLHDAGAVVLLDKAGTEIRRVGGTTAGATMDAPFGVAFDHGTLLVTNQSKTKGSAAVLAVGIR
jgi:sugar lactone lactonase YvrE